MPDVKIIASRVQLADPSDGTVTTSWYRFFYGLWQLVGQGGNTTSIADLTLAPSTAGLREQVAVLMKASAAVPVIDYGTATTIAGTGVVTVTFAKTFTVTPSVVCTTKDGSYYVMATDTRTTTTFRASSWISTTGTQASPVNFDWIAVGV